MTLYFVVTVPLAFDQQLDVRDLCFLFALLFRRLQGPYATLVMIMLSLVASGRYMYWRLTETTYWEHPLDAAWGLLLVSAEVYSTIVLLLGYFQTAWPLQAHADAAARLARPVADRRRLHPDLQRAARRW